MKEINFTISGNTITNYVREKYKETNDVSIAVGLLTEIVIGIPVDLATSIVLGNKKLVGENEVFVEDDSTEVYPYGLIKPSEPCDVICGWISPDGEIYGHRSYNNMNDHHVLAIEICKLIDIESFNEEWDLEKRDYLKFQPDKVMAGDHAATMAQKRAIAEICKSHNCKMQIGWVCHDMYSGNQIEEMELVMFNKHLNRTQK